MLSRSFSPGLCQTVIERPQVREVNLTLSPLPGESIPNLFRKLDKALREQNAKAVRHEVFGAVANREEALTLLTQLLGTITWPVTWVEGGHSRDEPIAGMHVTAISGTDPEPLVFNDRIVGCIFHEDTVRHCMLGALEPRDLIASRSDQAAQMFEEIEAVLDSVGMGMLDVVRTWFFLDEILRWYDDFNKVRTHFFNARRVFKGLVPASTGVGTKNPRGAAVIAAARAFQGSPEHLSGYEVGSPLQCSATDYGSSFSRAVELRMTGCRQVIVSGTASIDADGLSVCQGDAESQIDLSMEVVRAILNSCNMDFGDASRITGYFKFPQDASLFKAWQSRHGLQNWPAVCAQAEICRDELLFEIELDAIKEN